MDLGISFLMVHRAWYMGSYFYIFASHASRPPQFRPALPLNVDIAFMNAFGYLLACH